MRRSLRRYLNASDVGLLSASSWPTSISVHPLNPVEITGHDACVGKEVAFTR
jgi:hypothetical protein